jgi:ketosteroid isomerase-like protein
VTHPGATIAAADYPGGEVRIGGGVAAEQFPGIAAMSEAPNERYLASEVWQDGDIATVWGPYEISLGARVLHCGYDAFNMVRVNGAWQFAGAVYSARPDGCPAIRAAAKAGPRKATAAERADVMKAVEGFFQAMRARDSAGLANGFTSRANWVTVAYRDGKASVNRRPAAADVGRMSRAPQDLDERFLKDPVVRVDGDIALVWGSYQFKVGGKVSHCGYDSFHMLKENGAWRLEGGIYTVRPDGCP